MAKSGKHRTVGVSFNPDLRERANLRARQLGLTFSRFVTLCVEAELSGKISGLLPDSVPTSPEMQPAHPHDERDIDLADAVEKGGQFGAMKALSIGFEDDIQEILDASEVCYDRFAPVGALRSDFLIEHVEPKTDRHFKIAIECRYNIRNRYAVTLGQTIVLKSQPELDAVILTVPYLTNFDPQVLAAFDHQGIPVSTPDTVVKTLEKLLKRLESSD